MTSRSGSVDTGARPDPHPLRLIKPALFAAWLLVLVVTDHHLIEPLWRQLIFVTVRGGVMTAVASKLE
ncbi:hypothetical protein [Streptomyces syringium]|uniref:hypothetical protein n=1 Tax=Streptomyces syringium TaxID=76729 RepID=UPI003452579D